MKTNTLAWLSSTAVLASIVAGCGINPASNNNLTTLSNSTSRLYADGNGVGRRFGYLMQHRSNFSAPALLTGNFRSTLPASVDLRSTGKVSPVYDQGQLGSCTAFAMGKGLRETLTNMSGSAAKPVSALYLYYKERQLRGSVNDDSGAMMSDGVNVLKTNGDCLDGTMPYDIAKFKVKPSAAAEKEAANLKIDSYTLLNGLDGLKAELAAGHPAVFGFTVYQSFMKIDSTGKMPMPAANESVLGGHAVFIVGYDDAKQVLIIRNSWSTTWGDKGYFYMPYAYVTADKVDEIYAGSSHN